MEPYFFDKFVDKLKIHKKYIFYNNLGCTYYANFDNNLMQMLYYEKI
jgi:hypothetical protein